MHHGFAAQVQRAEDNVEPVAGQKAARLVERAGLIDQIARAAEGLSVKEAELFLLFYEQDAAHGR